MMGQHARSESLFCYFRLEDQVPENHLLRSVDEHIDFGFVRERLKHSYRDTGRPSVDPELLLRILLIGYLYGISSERRLVEEPGPGVHHRSRFHVCDQRWNASTHGVLRQLSGR
jgi:transposase